MNKKGRKNKQKEGIKQGKDRKNRRKERKNKNEQR